MPEILTFEGYEQTKEKFLENDASTWVPSPNLCR
jgi:hypothetical protein